MKKINKGSKGNKTAFHFVKTKLGFVGAAIVLVVLSVSLCALLSSCVSPTTVSQPPSPSYQELLSSPTPLPSPTDPLPSPTSTSAALQTDQTVEWKVYTSPLGYSIKYPPTWFAAPNPGIGRGDILYEKEDFLKVASGEVIVNQLEWESYLFIGVQQFTFDELNLISTDSVEKAAKVIGGDSVVHQEESFLGTGRNGLLQIKEVQKRYRVIAYFIHKNKVYMIYSPLPDPQDSYRIEVFKRIASSIQFPK